MRALEGARLVARSVELFCRLLGRVQRFVCEFGRVGDVGVGLPEWDRACKKVCKRVQEELVRCN